jgi:3-hydroxyisobutyrate dehydrogenase-like beta-hydroxyacid dehydrogenase
MEFQRVMAVHAAESKRSNARPVQGRVGFIGLGIMGGAMAANLISVGVDLIVHDVRPEAMDRVAHRAAVQKAGSPAEVASAASVLFTCLPDEDAVRAVYFGAEGILVGATTGLVTAECSTISPTLALEIAQRLSAAGLRPIETVLIGRRSQAESGEIFFIVSGPRETAEEVAPLLSAMGREWRHLGPHGAAARVKLLQNALGYYSAAATTEVLALARATGVDLLAFAELVNEAGGIGGSTYFREHAADVALSRDSGSGRLRIAAKDMQLITELAARAGMSLPVLAEVDHLFSAAVELGLGEDEYTATWRVLEARYGRRLFGNDDDPGLRGDTEGRNECLETESTGARP